MIAFPFMSILSISSVSTTLTGEKLVEIDVCGTTCRHGITLEPLIRESPLHMRCGSVLWRIMKGLVCRGSKEGPLQTSPRKEAEENKREPVTRRHARASESLVQEEEDVAQIYIKGRVELVYELSSGRRGRTCLQAACGTSLTVLRRVRFLLLV